MIETFEAESSGSDGVLAAAAGGYSIGKSMEMSFMLNFDSPLFAAAETLCCELAAN